MAQTRSQQRLALAIACVEEAAQADVKTQGVYRGLCHSFPVFVLSGGLAQALAFTESKAKQSSSGIPEAHWLLREHIARIVGQDPATMLESIRTESVEEYLYLTREILDTMVFFKRFATARLTEAEGENE